MLSLDDYRAMFLAAPDGWLVVDATGVIRDANPKAVSLFGWARDELVGAGIDLLVPEGVRARHARDRAQFMRQPRDRPMGVGLDLKGRRKDGTTFPVEISLSPFESEAADVRVICAVRDVSDHRRLRDFSEGALRASEEERQRIARELHDDTAQRLATLILRVRTLAEEPSTRARAGLLDEIRGEIVEAAEEVKRISRGLRPPELEEVGLVAAVRAHVRSLPERAGFTVEADLEDVDPYLDATAKLALYRIIQEALSNGLRHADATRARLRLGVDDGCVIAVVEDDGRGFDPHAALERDRGLGLIGMRERAIMAGGRLVVESTPGRGSIVQARIPIGVSPDG